MFFRERLFESGLCRFHFLFFVVVWIFDGGDCWAISVLTNRWKMFSSTNRLIGSWSVNLSRIRLVFDISTLRTLYAYSLYASRCIISRAAWLLREGGPFWSSSKVQTLLIVTLFNLSESTRMLRSNAARKRVCCRLLSILHTLHERAVECM